MARLSKNESNALTVGKFPIVYLRTDEVIPYARNTKIHDEAQIAKLKSSIHEFDFDQPIVVDKDMVVIKGHGRLMAAQALGLVDIPVIIRDDMTPQQAQAARIADNKIAASTGMDNEMLLLEVGELKTFADDLTAFTEGFSVDLIGFTDVELAKIEDEEETREAREAAKLRSEEEKDALPPLPPPLTVLGDVYLLGRHRLVCGNSKGVEALSSVLLGEEVDMLLTDPPYGISYSKKNEAMDSWGKKGASHEDIEGDEEGEGDYRQFFTEFLSIIPMAPKNTMYCFMMGSELHNLRLAMGDAGFTWADYIIWNKNNLVLGRKDYKAKHEFIAYGWKGTHIFYGPANRCTVIDHPKPQKTEGHPTMKPVALLERLIEDGSAPGAIVFDAFGGSGSTMIACENTGRKCRSVEISPRYCDLAVKRWETQTGQKAQRFSAEQWRTANGL